MFIEPMHTTTQKQHSSKSTLFSLIKPYRTAIVLLVILTVAADGLGLVVPSLISRGIDTYASGQFDFTRFVIQFALVSMGIFVFTYLQQSSQVYTAERVARDLREKLAEKIS